MEAEHANDERKRENRSSRQRTVRARERKNAKKEMQKENKN